MKKITYKTKGTCSSRIDVTVDDNNKITECKFTNGCQGNTAGIARLVIGMDAKEAVNRLKGIQCGMKGTSCPDQLANALEKNI